LIEGAKMTAIKERNPLPKLDVSTGGSSVTREELEVATPSKVREHIRAGRWRGHTKRLAYGHQQANLIIMRSQYAFDFLRFCLRNPSALALLDVTDPGDPTPRRVAPDGDVRTDVGDYSIYRNGQFVERMENITPLWSRDHVAFLTGCQLSLARPLEEAGIELPHVAKGAPPSPAMYISNRQCVPAGVFHGPLVVGIKIVPNKFVIPMTAVTSRLPDCLGGPVHIGDPGALGIQDVEHPDWGDGKPVKPGQTAMFWGCGLTAQMAAMESGIPEMITQTVGRMFITDLPVVPA
jgi:uncharacterized protein YcsI (UPF0317 family)